MSENKEIQEYGPTEKQKETIVNLFNTLSKADASTVIAMVGGLVNNRIQYSKKKKEEAAAQAAKIQTKA